MGPSTAVGTAKMRTIPINARKAAIMARLFISNRRIGHSLAQESIALGGITAANSSAHFNPSAYGAHPAGSDAARR